MELWQMDVVGGIGLTDGRTAKALTGLDDHSRSVWPMTAADRSDRGTPMLYRASGTGWIATTSSNELGEIPSGTGRLGCPTRL